MKLVAILIAFFSLSAAALPGVIPPSQEKDESSNESVVRNKIFYKTGKFEPSIVAGTMPYDSLINHYLLGGRLAWHLSDHFGWEVADLQFSIPSVTAYTRNFVTQFTVSDLETQRLKMIVASNFLMSPIYGKIRLTGSQVLYFDLYLVAGVGVANNDTVKVFYDGTSAQESIVRTGFDPLFDFGLGFKFFLNRAMGLTFDLRDYVVYSELYGKKTMKSNYTVSLGLCFYLPTF